MDKYEVQISIGFVRAETLEEAQKKALKKLEDYAGSNDGSELLANAEPILFWQDPLHT